MTSAAALAALLAASALAVDAQPFSACDVASYYASLPTAPLDADRADMHQMLEDTHRDQLPYTSTSPDVWDALIDVDSDASGENVRLVYKDAWVPATPYDSGACDSWNREHLWSRSHGVGSSGMDNTDLHHLRPSDCNVNTARSNRYFGACGTARPASECMSPAHVEAAADTSRDAETFLPPADRRGDIARAILYMDLRYDGGETSTTLDLVVSDCPEAVPDGAGMGYLSQLLQWHLDDPPGEEERQRNDKVCADWQGNRNPFVDYPELALKYHGGARPLLGDGLGYDCEATPAAGTCSDGSGSCLSTNHCGCSSSLFSRELTGLRGKSPPARKLDTSKLLITGVFDGPLSGGLPKMVELYATDDISDLSAYGVGSANNGGGTDGEEFELSGSAAAGSFITVSKEATRFMEYFGEAPTFLSGTMSVNGDDAIELFFNGALVDVFGDANTDGTGEAWEYMDGFAYR
ncbi:hypothetical protein ACHAXT_005432, partial [Thalassiosira profunda]